MSFIKSRFIVFFATFILGIASFWTVMLTLTILDAQNVINKWNLDRETREIILDIQCGDDEFCRGERCGA